MIKLKYITLFFLSLFLFSCGYWINPRYIKMSKKTQNEHLLNPIIEPETYYNKTNNIYSIDVKSLEEIIKISSKKYVVIYFFAHWCSSCPLSIKKLNEFYKKNKSEVEIIFISTSDWLEVKDDKLFLEKYGFKNNNLLAVNIFKYGTKFMNWERLNNFSKELLSKEIELRLPSYFLFNNKGELLKSQKAPNFWNKFDKEKIP